MSIFKKQTLFVLSLCLILSIVGCEDQRKTIPLDNPENSISSVTLGGNLAPTPFDELFSTKDLESNYKVSKEMKRITLLDKNITRNTSAVTILDHSATISKEGTYLIQGSLTDGQIIVDAKKNDEIQLVLDHVEIDNSSLAPLYIKQAGKVYITLADNSMNTLRVSGEFLSVDDNNVDAVIFSKENLTLNGNGSLILNNDFGHGITSKDNVVITDGKYTMDVSGYGIEGKDSVRISNGDFIISSGKDALVSKNSEEENLGFISIFGGQFSIKSKKRGIQSSSAITINGGKFHILQSEEGIEGKSIQINGGHLSIVSEDDGLNATNSSKKKTIKEKTNPDSRIFIAINGGTVHINAKGDGIDSNGDFYIAGGETYISSASDSKNGALDYDYSAQITAGLLLACGTKEETQNFGDSSTQGSMLITLEKLSKDPIVFKNQAGTELISFVPPKAYNSMVISSPDLIPSKTYRLLLGDQVHLIKMTDLIYRKNIKQDFKRLSTNLK